MELHSSFYVSCHVIGVHDKLKQPHWTAILCAPLTMDSSLLTESQADRLIAAWEQDDDPPAPLPTDDEIAALATEAARQVVAMMAPTTSTSTSTAGPTPQAAEVPPSTSYPTLQEIAAELSTSQDPRLLHLHQLIVAWQEGKLIMKNQSFGTPYEIISWLAENSAIAPSSLFHHVHQIYYDKGKCDDKHFYIASLLKKMLDMVSCEYGISSKELYTKFGTPEFYQCAAQVDSKHMGKVIGKKRCNKVANGGVFCATHCDQCSDPASDFKRWKGAAAQQ